jgi:hypothetical protein
VRLKQHHPELYEEEKRYEALGLETNGRPFYWNAGESLEEIEQPERTEQTEREWMEAQEATQGSARQPAPYPQPRRPGVARRAEERGCLICHL